MNIHKLDMTRAPPSTCIHESGLGKKKKLDRTCMRGQRYIGNNIGELTSSNTRKALLLCSADV
jgi:hypothetical protein